MTVTSCYEAEVCETCTYLIHTQTHTHIHTIKEIAPELLHNTLTPYALCITMDWLYCGIKGHESYLYFVLG